MLNLLKVFSVITLYVLIVLVWLYVLFGVVPPMLFAGVVSTLSGVLIAALATVPVLMIGLHIKRLLSNFLNKDQSNEG